jgi:ribonuclease Z
VNKLSTKLHILGTGTGIVTKYINSSLLLENEKGFFLIDGTGGAEILKVFDQRGFDWAKLKAAFLSHEHTDHILGMVWAVRMVAFLMNLGQYEGVFPVYGNEVALGKLLKICQMVLQKSEVARLEKEVQFVVVDHREVLETMNYRFTFYDILSTKAPQFGFHLEYDQGKRLMYMGDEPYRGGVDDLLQSCDWLISEAYCLYRDREWLTPYKYHHATVREAAELAEKFGIKNLILWHTEDSTDPKLRKANYTEEARQFYSGNVFVPDDGETFLI